MQTEGNDSGAERFKNKMKSVEVPVRPSSQKETTFRRTLREPVRMARGEDAGTPAISASAHHFLTSDLDLASAEDAQIVSTHHVTRQREAQKHGRIGAAGADPETSTLNLSYLR